ncbi:serine/threonine protein kinase [Nonomuraea polychroma]|uniref:non-specific serine/threonine protein kinase n=1 Tax=Nonomuraea polychroma TaxID=46176 RepID=A0A438M344_9ACTN|nr:serine/threonine-protein kinase [Nonomuraea polychroma]RVX40071.1 serine/threonine protein kinase [Nonomuraea polychroma]
MPNVEPLRDGDPAAVGPYRLVGRLGAGGHGVVYLGQARNGTPVAVKVLREGPAGKERLAAAIAAAREVEPFCLARVLDGSTDGRPYIVSEYVEGRSLQQAAPLAGTELRRLAVATATALDAIHQAGVLHLDFKPPNVLIEPDGARVVDFGIAGALGAGMSATGNVVGTPAYMAPEQLAGKAAGAPADVFAWASVAVFAATGVPPFGDDSLPAVANRILRDEPRIDELGPPLRDVVAACLAKDPAARPTMRDVLLRLIGGERPDQPRRHPARTPANDDYATPASPARATPPASHGEAASGTAARLDPASGPRTAPVSRADSAHPGRASRADSAHPGRASRADSAHPGRASRADSAHPRRPSQHDPAHPGRELHDDPAEAAAPHHGAGPHQPSATYATQPLSAPVDVPLAAREFPAAGQATGGQPGITHHTAGHTTGGNSSVAHHATGHTSGANSSVAHHATGLTTGGNSSATHHGIGGHAVEGAHPAAGHVAVGGYQGGSGDAADAGYPGGVAYAADHGRSGAAAGEPEPVGGAAAQHSALVDILVAGRPGTSGKAPKRPARRRLKTVMIAGVSGVSVLALAAAIVWLTPTTPTPKADGARTVPSTAGAPTSDASPTPTRTPRSQRTRTARPTPQTDGTPSIVPTDGPTDGPSAETTPAAVTGRLRVVYLRAGGTLDGDCWAGGEVTLQALVARTGDPLTFRYAWLIDGVPVARSSAIISENGRRYLTSPRNLTGTAGATHRVTLRITSPVPMQRSISVTLCDDV